MHRKLCVQKKYLRQAFVIFPACITGYLSGMVFVWPAANFKFLKSDDFGKAYTNDELTLTASFGYFGRIIVPFLSSFVLSKLGRKPPIVISAVSMLLASVILIVSKEPYLVYLSRFTSGIASGITTSFCNVYIGEVSSKNVRGIFSGLYITFYNLGSFLQFVYSKYYSYKSNNVKAAVIAVTASILSYYIHESPFFLINDGNSEKAYKILAYLRDDDSVATRNELHDTNALKTSKSIKEFFTSYKKPEMYKSFGIVSIMGVVASILMTVMFSFANYLMPSSTYLTSEEFAMVINSLPVISSLSSSFFIDKCGRRSLSLVSLAILAIVGVALAVLFYLDENTTSVPKYNGLCSILILLSVAIFSFGTYSVLIAVRSEIFPPAFRVSGNNVNLLLNSLICLIVTVIFMKLKQINALYLIFAGFAISCVVAQLYVYYVLPETKGKTLNEIQRILRGEKPDKRILVS